MGDKTHADMVRVTWPGSHSRSITEPGIEPRSLTDNFLLLWGCMGSALAEAWMKNKFGGGESIVAGLSQ